MNKRYRYCLSKWGHKDKVVLVAAYSFQNAHEMIKENFPDWQVSQFWIVWP